MTTPGVIEVRTGAVGPAGADGAPGADGADGADGVDGADGAGTTILNLSDTPDAYAGSERATVYVNAAGTAIEFKYSTDDYLDIRDFYSGTLANGADITTALNAALTYGDANRRYVIRITRQENSSGVKNFGSYTLDGAAVSWPVAYLGESQEEVKGWFLELDCQLITLTSALSPPRGSTIRGVMTLGLNLTGMSGAIPFGRFERSTFPAIHVDQKENVTLQNLNIKGGLLIDESAIILCRRVFVEAVTSGTTPAIKLNNAFWITLDECAALANHTGGYSVDFTTETDITADTGLVRIKDLRVNNNGIRIMPTHGSYGIRGILIDDLISENQDIGTTLITFDNTLGAPNNASIGDIWIRNPGIADPLGTTYYIKNIGSRTSGIHLDTTQSYSYGWIDPTSDPIRDFYHNQLTGGPASGESNFVRELYVGSEVPLNFRRDSANIVDAKLSCAPLGPQWVIGTPVNVAQDPASWSNVGGTSVVTTGQLAPDGSTLAATCTGGSPNGMKVEAVVAGVDVGDWFVAGIWAKANSGTAAEGEANLSIQQSGWSLNNGGSAYFATTADSLQEDGWKWLCGAFQVTTDPGGACTAVLGFAQSGSDTDYFNPSIQHIDASLGYDDVFVINYARSLRGGWSPTASASNVSLLDHQLLYAKGGVEVTDEAYDATGWNGDLTVPTKNAVRDKIEALALGGSQTPWTSDIDADGNDLTGVAQLFVGVDTGTAFDTGNDNPLTPPFQVVGTTAATSALGFARFSAAGEPRIMFLRSRGATVGDFTIVNTGDNMGEFSWSGSDGSDAGISVKIIGVVEGTPGNGTIPGSLQIHLTEQGNNDTTHFWTFTSAGNFVPATDAVNDIGTSSVGINDLHFSSGSIINFDGGDVTITHAANALAVVGGLVGNTGAGTTIASDAITATSNYMVVDTEASAASDDLSTINGGISGARLVIRAASSARDVVIKDGVGNIQCAGDFTLNNVQDTIELIYDATLSAWLEIGRSDNGA
jgi:hypothetical protein